MNDAICRFCKKEYDSTTSRAELKGYCCGGCQMNKATSLGWSPSKRKLGIEPRHVLMGAKENGLVPIEKGVGPRSELTLEEADKPQAPEKKPPLPSQDELLSWWLFQKAKERHPVYPSQRDFISWIAEFRTRGPKLIEELLRKTCDEYDVSVPRR